MSSNLATQENPLGDALLFTDLENIWNVIGYVN